MKLFKFGGDLLKKILVSIVSIVVVVYISIHLYTKFKLDTMREKVKGSHPEITKVESVNSIGHWGERFSEYTFIVEIGGKKYRIWTFEDGKITGKELIK
ncbi:hypothetical protein [Metabacillus fastidiosus]|uniref:PepSY domain-containing protein n=1 Tax=Metabacillus fastidiosus TaxID=1458 RepID=A0ABU6NYK3_9BACI|nr:hypothetical protein [Metabacillus fastidiosus]MED4402121.1 hypothetical protein [Metabacillus fastidiosus]